MIKKEELIKLLEEAQLAEEKSIPVYMKHLNSAVFWIKLDKEKVEKVKSLLTVLKEGSESHKRRVEGMIGLVKKDKRDAF